MCACVCVCVLVALAPCATSQQVNEGANPQTTTTRGGPTASHLSYALTPHTASSDLTGAACLTMQPRPSLYLHPSTTSQPFQQPPCVVPALPAQLPSRMQAQRLHIPENHVSVVRKSLVVRADASARVRGDARRVQRWLSDVRHWSSFYPGTECIQAMSHPWAAPPGRSRSVNACTAKVVVVHCNRACRDQVCCQAGQWPGPHPCGNKV